MDVANISFVADRPGAGGGFLIPLPLSALAVNFFAVSDADDEDRQYVVVNLIDDPVITDAQAVGVFCPGEFADTYGAWSVGMGNVDQQAD